MSDATGKKDWPGAGPYTVQCSVDGVLVPFYTHPREMGGVQLIQANPIGTRDALLKEFSDVHSAQHWLEAELRAGRVPRRSTSAKFDQALATLREKGHLIPEGAAVVGPMGKVLTPVDGVLRTHNEMYAMAGMPLEPE
jgi:hypothetical protein